MNKIIEIVGQLLFFVIVLVLLSLTVQITGVNTFGAFLYGLGLPQIITREFYEKAKIGMHCNFVSEMIR